MQDDPSTAKTFTPEEVCAYAFSEEGLQELAKGLVVAAVRNGPIETVHAGKECPTCAASDEYSRITQDEMKAIMKHAVDRTYTALTAVRNESPIYLLGLIAQSKLFAGSWDAPEQLPPPRRVQIFPPFV